MSRLTFNDPHGTSLAARQGLLDNRCEHKSKNHRTLGRRKRLAKKKRDEAKARLILKIAKHRKYTAAVRAYWRYESDNHPLL